MLMSSNKAFQRTRTKPRAAESYRYVPKSYS